MRILIACLSLCVVVAASAPARADTCSGRHGICQAACTPALVSSGQQHGGTVQGCMSSCRSRFNSCMRTGVWVHMGSQNRGMKQTVDRQ
jgi:hypothetical protein